MKKALKGIALIMTLVMVLSLFIGCQGGKKSSSVQTSSAEQKSTSTSAAETGQQDTLKMKDAATIVFKTYHSPYDGDENFQNTTVGKIIKDKLNIDLKVLASKSDGDQDMLADMAANDLPDIIAFWANDKSIKVMNKAANEGLLAELNDSIAKYGSLIEKSMDKSRLSLYINNYIYSSELNGKIYFLPTYYNTVSPWKSGFGLYVREDAAKTLGIATPDTDLKTADDLYNILTKIKQAGIKDVNGKPAYPLGILWFYNIVGRQFDFGGKDGIGVENGKVKLFINSEYAWSTILLHRKLVKEGLIDPESYTHTYEKAFEKIAQGKYAVLPYYAINMLPDSNTLKALTGPHPEMAYKPLGNMVNYMGSKDITLNIGGESGLALAISKKANLEAAIKLINTLSNKEGRATVAFGALDQQWIWNDKGYAEMKPDIYNEYLKDPTAYDKKNGTGNFFPLSMLSSVGGLDNPDLNAFGGQGSDIYYQSNPKRNASIDDFMNGQMPVIKVLNKLSFGSLFDKYPQKDRLSALLPETGNGANLLSSTTSEASNVFKQCILASSDKEANDLYDKYVDKLDKNGLQEYIDYLQKEYDKNPDLFATYTTE